MNYNISIKLPDNFNIPVITPKKETISLPNNSGQISLVPTINKNQWNETININTTPKILNPEQYNQLQNIKQKISSPETRTFLLKQ